MLARNQYKHLLPHEAIYKGCTMYISLFEPKLHSIVVLCTHNPKDKLSPPQSNPGDPSFCHKIAATILSLSHRSPQWPFCSTLCTTVFYSRRTASLAYLATKIFTPCMVDTP